MFLNGLLIKGFTHLWCSIDTDLSQDFHLIVEIYDVNEIVAELLVIGLCDVQFSRAFCDYWSICGFMFLLMMVRLHKEFHNY